MFKALPILVLLFVSQMSFAQSCVNVNYKLRGYFYAGTSITDTLSPGGYASSKNHPKPITNTIDKLAQDGAFQVIVLPNSEVSFTQKTKGIRVLVINKSDATVGIPAQDSRIDMIRQVFYKGSWQDVEYLPSSWCGNSYHSVYIKSNEHWDFTAPCIEGKIEAKFRFAMYIDEDTTVYSNEFSGSFNKGQLKKEQGHTANGLMDPYDN